MNTRATDPAQYDSPELDWTIAGAEERPSRKFFRAALDTVILPNSLVDKQILDIGCGVGHLFNWLKQKEVAGITAFDPSKQNIEIVQQMYPWVHSSQSTLTDFAATCNTKFNVAFAVMVFEHMGDLKTAYEEIHGLLSTDGIFYLIIGDKDFHLSSDPALRQERFVSVEIVRELPESSVETKTIRREADGSQSIMHDIFRPIQTVREAAKAAGFELMEEKPLLSPAALEEGQEIATCHLLVFKRA